LIVHITHEDIKLGEPGDGNKCPVALALKRAFVTKSVTVGPAWCNVNNQPIDLPDRIYQWVNDFDNYVLVTPTEFNV
jgi:hypothetical protein